MQLTAKSYLRSRAVIARNWLVYKQHSYWAATTQDNFPLDPNSNFAISIASYPKRLHLIPSVFESLARQTVRPRHAFLVLSDEDFPNRNLPTFILTLVERGVEIVWVKNNPFAVKKLIPIYQNKPDYAVCTLDDDTIYGENVLEGLVKTEAEVPGAIIGYWAKALYKKEDKLSIWYRSENPVTELTPMQQVYLLGGGGVLYPPKSLDDKCLDIDAIHKYVPGRGSDIWFWAAARAAGTGHVRASKRITRRMWIPIPQTARTLPKEQPGSDVLEHRFQAVIDFFNIRETLLNELPDLGERHEGNVEK